MTLKLITAPATEPVTLAEAKLHCRIDSDITDDDDLIEDVLIPAARAQCEHLLNRALITQTWERVIDAFPEVEIELGMPPVASITSVTYIDSTGTPTVLDSAAYTLDDDNLPGWCLPAYSYTWPTTYETANAVRVRFVAGYGGAAQVPQAIRSWLLLRVATLYKFREEIQAGVSIAALPGTFTDRLLDRYRVWSI